jgi:hypothetical protein
MGNSRRHTDFWDPAGGFFLGYSLAQDEMARQNRSCQAAQQEQARRELREQVRAVAENLSRELDGFLTLLDALPDGRALRPLAVKTALYEMTAGLIARGELLPPFLDVLGFLCERPDVPCGKGDVEAACSSGAPLYRTAGILTDAECGLFWQKLMTALTASPRGDGYPYAQNELLQKAEEFYFDFAGDSSVSLRYCEHFQKHLWELSLFSPDPAKLRETARQRNFSDDPYVCPCRDLMTASFPELRQRWSCEQLAGMDAETLLAAVYEKDAALAVKMWRLLLDAADELLQQPEVARRLLGMEFAGRCRRTKAESCGDRFDPILDELEKDEGFARQLYQSAALGENEAGLLAVCCARGRVSLMERLRRLLADSPFLTDIYPGGMPKWMRLLPADGSREDAPGDSREYRCCRVAVGGGVYAYLCGDPTIALGDAVRVPFGKDNETRVGIVRGLELCTAADAPYPPERMKALLGRAAPENKEEIHD